MAEKKKPAPVKESPSAVEDRPAAKEPAAVSKEVAVEVVVDPTIPVAHAPSKADVGVSVPRTAGQYGVVFPGGAQIIYDVQPEDEFGGTISVHPDHLQRVLFSIRGSRQLKPAPLTAEQEAAEAARPVGRQAGPPLTAEEVAAHVAANPLVGATEPAPAPKVQAKKK